MPLGMAIDRPRAQQHAPRSRIAAFPATRPAFQILRQCTRGVERIEQQIPTALEHRTPKSNNKRRMSVRIKASSSRGHLGPWASFLRRSRLRFRFAKHTSLGGEQDTQPRGESRLKEHLTMRTVRTSRGRVFLVMTSQLEPWLRRLASNSPYKGFNVREVPFRLRDLAKEILSYPKTAIGPRPSRSLQRQKPVQTPFYQSEAKRIRVPYVDGPQA